MVDRLAEIFKRQAEYVESIRAIQEKNALAVPPYPLGIDNRAHQEIFRLLAWRFTEEVTEAIASFETSSSWIAKFREEIADALHFLIELALAAGISEAELISGIGGSSLGNRDYLSEIFNDLAWAGSTPGAGASVPTSWAAVIVALGFAMQNLRQRPWRTDHRPTNRKIFVAQMSSVLRSFIVACMHSGITADILYNAYFAKAKIIDQRTAEQK
jgi:hypothetical protein